MARSLASAGSPTILLERCHWPSGFSSQTHTLLPSPSTADVASRLPILSNWTLRACPTIGRQSKTLSPSTDRHSICRVCNKQPSLVYTYVYSCFWLSDEKSALWVTCSSCALPFKLHICTPVDEAAATSSTGLHMHALILSLAVKSIQVQKLRM